MSLMLTEPEWYDKNGKHVEIKSVGEDSVDIGHNLTDSTDNSVIIGYNVENYGDKSVTIGNESSNNGHFSTVVGYKALVPGPCEGSVAMGYQASAAEDGSVAIGNQASGTGYESVAIGNQASATGDGSVAIGVSAHTNDDNDIQLGNNGEVYTIHIGNGTTTEISGVSDARLKENIEPVDTSRCLKDVLRLPVNRYKYKNFVGNNTENSDTHRTGWLASDVEKVFPKNVTVSDETYPLLNENGEKQYDANNNLLTFVMHDVKHICMQEALPTLWAAVQELSKKYEELSNKYNELSKNI